MAAVASLALCSLGVGVGSAAEIKVLTSVALSSALNQMVPNFEQTTGNKLDIGYSLIADIRKRVLDGETADVIILSRPVMDELDKQQKFASGSITNVAGTPVAVAIRAGAPKPDIGNVDALKRTLLAAKSIVYSDPAKGGASGVYFAHVVDRLGIADQLKSKTILVPGAQAPEIVAKGEAEIGVAQGSEIVPVAGAEVLGPLPGEFASTTLFTAGIGATSKVPDAAKSLIQFLTGPAARPVFSARGFQPG
jgi:molybdate transport system substrate-binding protein